MPIIFQKVHCRYRNGVKSVKKVVFFIIFNYKILYVSILIFLEFDYLPCLTFEIECLVPKANDYLLYNTSVSFLEPSK